MERAGGAGSSSSSGTCSGADGRCAGADGRGAGGERRRTEASDEGLGASVWDLDLVDNPGSSDSSKMTSLLTRTFLVTGLYRRQPFFPSSNPRKMHFWECPSRLLR